MRIKILPILLSVLGLAALNFLYNAYVKNSHETKMLNLKVDREEKIANDLIESARFVNTDSLIKAISFDKNYNIASCIYIDSSKTLVLYQSIPLSMLGEASIDSIFTSLYLKYEIQVYKEYL